MKGLPHKKLTVVFFGVLSADASFNVLGLMKNRVPDFTHFRIRI